MLENLSERLQGIFSGLRSKGRLTEDDINAAMTSLGGGYQLTTMDLSSFPDV